MSTNQNPQAAALAYNRAAATVPPSRAVVLLYDKVLVLLQRAGQDIEERRMDRALEDVLKAAAILRGLSHIIDFKRGGALAERLYTMYTRNILAVLQSFRKPDAPERYRKISEGLAELRDAWAEIAGLPTRAQESAARGGHAAMPVEAVLNRKAAGASR
ncbi:flagellar export chaperone FliS [Rhodoplanes roseus]|uniref:Flagellar export chaperone FliS n=1 Tax=Rhodoplanes roseus TaxID=29409 RepID=A0A327KY25_9BRAD|nr:flagellar protein FliS [Rhodoplanes roseus]RAI43749.1 hypothetical protein CH341_12645 [Rhodoplanes roseus]